MRDQANNAISDRFSKPALLILCSLLLLSYVPFAKANQCSTSGPRYRLESDAVEWRMRIRSNENCVRGVRFSYVYNATVSLIAPPRSGHIALIGPGFSYTAKSGFRGEDSFIVGILGSKNKTLSTSSCLSSMLKKTLRQPSRALSLINILNRM